MQTPRHSVSEGSAQPDTSSTSLPEEPLPYRTRFLPPPECRVKELREELVARCAFPKSAVDDSDELEAEQRRFFSEQLLSSYLDGVKPDWIMRCKCKPCALWRLKLHNANNLTLRSVRDTFRSVKEGILGEMTPVLVVLIYLNRLYFLYPFLESPTDNHLALNEGTMDFIRKDYCTSPEHEDDEDSETRNFYDELHSDTYMFYNGFRDVTNWLKPFTFRLLTDFAEHSNMGDTARLPFIDPELIDETTRSMRRDREDHNMLSYFVREEHVHQSVRNRLTPAYDECVKQYGDNRYYHLAVKRIPRYKNRSADTESLLLNLMKGSGDKRLLQNTVFFIAEIKHRNYLNLVFPFIESSLDKVFSDGQPSEMQKIPSHWLWKQMRAVSEALSIFHTRLGSSISQEVNAFHFDIKPANILVTKKNKLQLADFGESSITQAGAGAAYTSGDGVYRAPEIEKARKQAEQLRISRVKASGSTTSTGSVVPLVLLNYDVWQLACVMVEVLVYIVYGHDGVHKLRRQGNREIPDFRFYQIEYRQPKLRDSVKAQIEKFSQDCPEQNPRLRRFIQDIQKLLFKMFRISPEDRISSSSVVKELDDMKFRYLRHDPSLPKTLRTLMKDDAMRARSNEIRNCLHQVAGKDGCLVLSCSLPSTDDPRGEPCSLRVVHGPLGNYDGVLKPENEGFRVNIILGTPDYDTETTEPYIQPRIYEFLPSRSFFFPVYMKETKETQWKCLLASVGYPSHRLLLKFARIKGESEASDTSSVPYSDSWRTVLTNLDLHRFEQAVLFHWPTKNPRTVTDSLSAYNFPVKSASFTTTFRKSLHIDHSRHVKGQIWESSTPPYLSQTGPQHLYGHRFVMLFSTDKGNDHQEDDLYDTPMIIPLKFAKCKVGLSENLVDIVPNKHSGNVKKWDLMSQQLSREVIDIANAESPGIPAIPLNQGFFPSADGAKNDANLLVRQYANGEVDLGQDRNLVPIIKWWINGFR